MAHRRRPVPLRWTLFALALGLLLPVVVFASALLLRVASQDRAATERRLVHRARTLADAIDGEMSASVRALEALAASELLDNVADLPRFHAEAKRVHETQPGWLAISLVDRDGTPLDDTSLGPGRRRDRPLDDASVARVVDTSLPAVGDLTTHPDGGWAFAIRVPVLRDGRVRFVLSAIVRPDVVVRVADAGGRANEDWARAVIDREGLVVARTRRQSEHVGRASTVSFAEGTADRDEGVFPSTTLEGVASYVAFRKTRLAGWTATVVVERDAVDGPSMRSLRAVIGSGLLLLIVGVGGAFVLGRRLSREIATVRDAAEALAHGTEPVLATSSIAEIDRLATAIERSGALLRAHESAREEHVRDVERQRQYAEDASRAKDEFLAMLGHELRNPLAPILSAIEIEKQGRPGSRELAIVERQVRHLTRLVDDLLDISRVTRGKIHLRRTTLEVGAVVQRAVEMTAPLFAARRHTLDVDVPTTALTVSGDVDRLTQVLGNLLTNAAKYTPDGGHVVLQARPRDAFVDIVVSDDGQGMSADLLERVFEPFVQAPRDPSRHEGGLGIGLTLVRQLVEAHGGQVVAESEGAGRGTTIRVCLPLAVHDAAGATVDSRDEIRDVQAEGAKPAAASPSRVLVVDDNEDAADLLAEVLARAGHEVVCARDGFDALDVLARFEADVAILDIGLPGLDGIELGRRIRDMLGDRAPVLVALTGYGQPSDRARTFAAGFALHLVKPADHDELLGVMPTLVRSRGASSEEPASAVEAGHRG